MYLPTLTKIFSFFETIGDYSTSCISLCTRVGRVHMYSKYSYMIIIPHTYWIVLQPAPFSHRTQISIPCLPTRLPLPLPLPCLALSPCSPHEPAYLSTSYIIYSFILTLIYLTITWFLSSFLPFFLFPAHTMKALFHLHTSAPHPDSLSLHTHVDCKILSLRQGQDQSIVPDLHAATVNDGCACDHRHE